MKIEEEIKQKAFKSNFQKAFINIMFTESWLRNENKKFFKAFDITAQQFNVLRILRGKHPETLSAGEVKSVMIDKTPDLTRLLDRLQKKGLITRKMDSLNRRLLCIGISKAGLDLLAEITPIIEAQMQALNRLTEEEAQQLSDLLDKFRG